jgi:hypothetical protein
MAKGTSFFDMITQSYGAASRVESETDFKRAAHYSVRALVEILFTSTQLRDRAMATPLSLSIDNLAGVGHPRPKP